MPQMFLQSRVEVKERVEHPDNLKSKYSLSVPLHPTRLAAGAAWNGTRRPRALGLLERENMGSKVGAKARGSSTMLVRSREICRIKVSRPIEPLYLEGLKDLFVTLRPTRWRTPIMDLDNVVLKPYAGYMQYIGPAKPGMNDLHDAQQYLNAGKTGYNIGLRSSATWNGASVLLLISSTVTPSAISIRVRPWAK